MRSSCFCNLCIRMIATAICLLFEIYKVVSERYGVGVVCYTIGK